MEHATCFSFSFSFFYLSLVDDDGTPVKINMASLVFGMRVLPLMMWGKKMTMSIRIREKRGSIGVYKCIGPQLPNRPSHASNSTPSTHIVWVYGQLNSSLVLTTCLLPLTHHRRCIRVRMTLQFGRSRSPPGFRARCLRWKRFSSRVWTLPPQATSCGSRTPRDGSRISISERTSRNEELISSRTRRSGV